MHTHPKAPSPYISSYASVAHVPHSHPLYIQLHFIHFKLPCSLALLSWLQAKLTVSQSQTLFRHQQSMLLKSSRIHSNHDDLPQSEERKLSTWLCIFLATTWKEATRAISHQTKYLTPRLLKALRNYNILVIINSSLDSDNMFHIDKKNQYKN